MRVKICGITSVEDALAAAAAGADAVGLVFAPSPRRVSPESARDIVAALPPLVTTVGVFVNASPAYIRRVRDYCGLDLVQLHGQEDPATVRALAPRVIKALPVSPRRVPSPHEFPGAMLLLDAALPGGGRSFDWSLVRELAGKRPLILAGGLDPENLVRAVETVRPFALDVCSGVETSPGKKDRDKMARFIARARGLRRAA